MSKSRGNVVDPLDIVSQYGADTLRVYVLFMGDYGSAAPWNDSSVKGCRRFLDRVAGLTDLISEEKKPASYETLLHKTIKKVTDDIEAQKFNTAIAALMTLINEIYKEGSITKENLVIFLKLLSPFAPHIAEEIYELIGGEGFITVSEWPEYDESKTVDATIEVGVQVNGKVRGAVTIPAGCDKDTALMAAKENARVASFIEGKKIVKEIYVPGKIINIVVK
jgi:leucyl-tRNA synthetase